MFWKSVGFGALAVLIFDALASFASVGLGFAYEHAALGSVFIYTLIGYHVFRCQGFFSAIGAVLFVAAVEATLGWYISWQIGPGALPPEQATTANITVAIVFSLIFATIFGAVGCGIARVVHGPRTDA